MSKMFKMEHADGRTCLVAHGDTAAEAAMAAKGFAREGSRVASDAGKADTDPPVSAWSESDQAQLESMTVPQLKSTLDQLGAKAPSVADKSQLREMLKVAVLAQRLGKPDPIPES